MHNVLWREVVACIYSEAGDWCLDGFWPPPDGKEEEADFMKKIASLVGYMVRFLLPGFPPFRMEVRNYIVGLPEAQSKVLEDWIQRFPEGTPDRWFYFPLTIAYPKESANGQK